MNRSAARRRIPSKALAHARQIDLLIWLQSNEPDNLVKLASGTYCTREHDSLKISNGKWFWWSRGFGGVSALDYLIKVREMKFVDAVQLLTGAGAAMPVNIPAKQEAVPKVLQLPKKNDSADRVTRYLCGRGIDRAIIRDCIDAGLLYESQKYHNAVFVGRDTSGTARYASLRGTIHGSSFKGDAAGSDKRYSFRLLAAQPTDSVHLFEAAIDLLSYATWLKHKGKAYRSENLLSLSGVYQPKQAAAGSKVPVALAAFLAEHPQTKTIVLHLDNDEAGRRAAAALMELLKANYKIRDAPPPIGKDVNEFLQDYLKRQRE